MGICERARSSAGFIPARTARRSALPSSSLLRSSSFLTSSATPSNPTVPELAIRPEPLCVAQPAHQPDIAPPCVVREHGFDIVDLRLLRRAVIWVYVMHQPHARRDPRAVADNDFNRDVGLHLP